MAKHRQHDNPEKHQADRMAKAVKGGRKGRQNPDQPSRMDYAGSKNPDKGKMPPDGKKK